MSFLNHLYSVQAIWPHIGMLSVLLYRCFLIIYVIFVSFSYTVKQNKKVSNEHPFAPIGHSSHVLEDSMV